MTYKDFFRVLIKIVGLYFFIQTLFSFLPSQISIAFLNSDSLETAGAMLYTTLIIVICFGILYFLIKNPDKIIDLFKLDKNFDNNSINIQNLNSKNLITIGLFIIGGYLVISNITRFIASAYYKMKLDHSSIPLPDINNSFTILNSALNVILGFILIVYRKNIAAYFEK
ncbi:hypothetical protein OZ664_03515 [Elizabethkingia sp. HX WHF]|uniref:hypothetical protein n=1 Tax=Elizabethkingia TaxID=308865 RepID=UPI00099ACA05|nr:MULTISPECIES: hypothetical protein [Elizabethkingia]ATL42425.1 hypothetical protein CQS02_03450 [Elizabethkingia miricola]MCL1638834.1 hypothetical protein [Elizabethkingia bruuniana]MDX8563056.1 hypothetical protein [Elizabethkingia sp. HX WHF]OPC21913.1 hypothetical protein BAY00_18600 [Elizabethkingia bruuniana]OPC54066.1 hypothetical protein BAY07_09635 [Elizabethkingia bruuniana]